MKKSLYTRKDRKKDRETGNDTKTQRKKVNRESKKGKRERRNTTVSEKKIYKGRVERHRKTERK